MNPELNQQEVSRLLQNVGLDAELKNSDLPDDVRIGAVLRDDKVIIPRSNFVFQKEDKVVFLAKKESISAVENIFRISSI